MSAESTRAQAGGAGDYERVGGGPAIRAVVDRFYELVLGDERLSGYFEGTDISALKRHQVLLVSQVMGGPAQYDGRDLRQAHAGLEIRDEHFGVVVTHLADAMGEAGVPPEIIARVGARLADTKQDVVSADAR